MILRYCYLSRHPRVFLTMTGARAVIERVLPLLEAAGRDTMRLPDPGRKRRRHADALLADIPELTVLVDSFEQRVQRPAVGQKEYYSEGVS